MASMGFIQDELDLKFLVLYIMARTAAPITFTQLLDLALCDAGVDYFSLTEAVTHMVETGQLSLLNEHYEITEKGRRNGEICQSSLPFSVRMHCDENLLKVNEVLRRKQQVKSEISPHDDGTCTLHLQLHDADSTLMDISLLLVNPVQAETVAKKFQANPPALYHAVTTALLAEF